MCPDFRSASNIRAETVCERPPESPSVASPDSYSPSHSCRQGHHQKAQGCDPRVACPSLAEARAQGGLGRDGDRATHLLAQPFDLLA